jgi:hypothetical protein
MPKMSHPNQVRPLSVQPEDVERYLADGWTVENAPNAARPQRQATKKAAEKKTGPTAVTRKSAAKK